MGSYRSKEDDVARISTFINVFNEERLVNNLCTVWSGRFKLQANIARFQRTPVNGNMNFTKDEGRFMGKNSHMNKKDNENSVAKEPKGRGNTYVQVVKGDVKTGGRVKEFVSLANLKVALCNEGFMNIKINVGSWFSQIIEASRDFVINGRIAWVEVEGVPFKLWSHNTFKRIADRWGKLLDVDDQEETCYHSKRLCIHTKSGRNILESFKIIHRGKAHWIRACETPGWVPDFADESDDEDQEDDMSNDRGAKEHIPGGGGMVTNRKMICNDADSSNVVGDNNATVKVERVNTICEANEGSGGFRVNGISKANSAKSASLKSEANKVSLGGCSFTWCHKTAAKMSKLDRFLVSESFLNSCPNINAITLERYLSDHRPILLRDAHVDYGPTPFRFFHYWLEMEGFAKMVEDGWRDSPCDSKRFCKPGLRNVNIQMTISNQISVDQKRDLEGEVTNDEIKKAVWDCSTDKAPGPDGFTFGFYRKFWYLIDNDVCDAVRFFFKNDNIPNGCNSSFIALIPKIPDANMVKDFRPISLVGIVYKIIAKILANRLVGVLGDIVSKVQSVFIAGKQILDGPFILNEVL
nr:nucleotide-binding alpha-beta plait domain-containing protein [Tanacetum cinerariifolium]